MKNTKNRIISFGLSDAEYKKLETYAGHQGRESQLDLSVSVWARSALLQFVNKWHEDYIKQCDLEIDYIAKGKQ